MKANNPQTDQKKQPCLAVKACQLIEYKISSVLENLPTAEIGLDIFRCREYDHFANECPNAVTDDSDGYESDRAALQLMTTEAEIHDNFDTNRLN